MSTCPTELAKTPTEAHQFSEDALHDFMLNNMEQCFPQSPVSSPKRYAIYLPSCPNLPDDALSSLAVGSNDCNNVHRDSASSMYSRSSASSSLLSSLGQRDAHGRARSTCEELSRATSDDGSASFGTCPEPSRESLTVTADAERSVKVKYRKSSHDAFMDARQEAIGVLKMNAIQGEKYLDCSRPGCKDRLPDLKSLTCHLHIHNMTDGYDSDDTHHSGCYLSVPGFNSYPILSADGFRRVISRLVHRRR